MRRTPAAFIGLTVVAALTACGARVSTAPAPKITLPPSQAPAPAGVTPTVVANPGTLTPCSQVPFPGPVAEEDQLHDCWVVEPLGSSDLSKYEFFMGGTSPTDPQQGLLVFQRQNGGRLRNVYSVPGRGGDVTVSLARWGFACYKAAGGAAGEFDAEAATFVTDPARIQTDCPRAP